MIIFKLVISLITCIFIPLTLIRGLRDKVWPSYVTIALCLTMATINLVDYNWWGLIWLGNAAFWGWGIWFKKRLAKRRSEHITTLRELELLLEEVQNLHQTRLNRERGIVVEEKKIKPEKSIKKFKL